MGTKDWNNLLTKRYLPVKHRQNPSLVTHQQVDCQSSLLCRILFPSRQNHLPKGLFFHFNILGSFKNYAIVFLVENEHNVLSHLHW